MCQVLNTTKNVTSHLFIMLLMRHQSHLLSRQFVRPFLVKLIGPLVSLLWYDLCAYKIYKDDNNRFCRYQYQLPLGQPNHTCGGANV